jgi:hypothetical protein
VPAPVILAHVAERGSNTALRGDRMRTRREDFRDTGGLQPGGGALQRSAQAGATRADNDDVEGVIGNGICGAHGIFLQSNA